MKKFKEEHLNDVFNAAVNILAVEFLVKANDRDTYSKYIDILYTFDEIDLDLLYILLSLNMHIDNLGAMITQGDYDEQKEKLLYELERKEKLGDDYI